MILRSFSEKPTGLFVKKVFDPIDEVEAFLAEYYDTRYNVVTGTIETKPKNETNFKKLTDDEQAILLRFVRQRVRGYSSQRLYETLLSDFSPRFDPFKDYFNGLLAWDGRTDHIQQLADTVTTTNQALWSKMLKKWLVATVGCSLAEGVNHTVLIFTGSQGIGKTTWLNRLIPEELKAYAYSGLVNPNNKDTLIHLAECMVIVMDELESLNKAGVESLKQMITQGANRIRRPYARNAERMLRRASFVGSTNNPEFLIDTTGSRRFLCNSVTEIRNDHAIDINSVYAQAFRLYQDGFKHWFDREETAELTAHNERFQVRSAEEEYLLQFVNPAAKNEGRFVSASEILTYLNSKAFGAIKCSPSTMGKVLAKNGYSSSKTNGATGYYVKYL